MKEETIKYRLSRLEGTGAATAEALLVGVRYYILTKEVFKGIVKTFNDNTKVINTINSSPCFKDLVSEYKWVKSKIWNKACLKFY